VERRLQIGIRIVDSHPSGFIARLASALLGFVICRSCEGFAQAAASDPDRLSTDGDSVASAERAARSVDHPYVRPASIPLTHEPHDRSTIRSLDLPEGPPRLVATLVAGADHFARGPPDSESRSKLPAEVVIPRWISLVADCSLRRFRRVFSAPESKTASLRNCPRRATAAGRARNCHPSCLPTKINGSATGEVREAL